MGLNGKEYIKKKIPGDDKEAKVKIEVTEVPRPF